MIRSAAMVRTAMLCAIAACALAACSKEADRQAPPSAAATSAAAAITTATPSAAASEDAHDIPAAVQGRWALVPADCSSTSGDAKGLLLIDATTLKFYESRARLGTVKQRSDRRIRASFAFSGEGQEWTLDVLLDAQSDGKTLVRRDYGPDAMPGALQYTRCPETE